MMAILICVRWYLTVALFLCVCVCVFLFVCFVFFLCVCVCFFCSSLLTTPVRSLFPNQELNLCPVQ